MKIEVAEGVEIELNAIEQRLTYMDADIDFIGKEENAEFLSDLLAQVKEQANDMIAVYGIEPKVSMYKHPEGTSYQLPGILCTAEFKCNEVFRDHDMNYSAMMIFWFQEDWVFPVAKDVVEKFKRIDWKNLSSEHQY